MPHFFINSNSINNNEIIISDKELHNHLTRSLRIKAGENIKFIDENKMQYETVAKNITTTTLTAEITKKYISKRFLGYDLCVAQSILKSDDQISSIQKATELGANYIYPIITDNCQVKKNIAKAKEEKWQKIASESSKQCERATIPQVKVMDNLKTLIDVFDNVIIFAEKNADTPLKEYISKIKNQKPLKILVVIGPEGGFSQNEFNYFQEKNLPLISLGNLIYRADTALAVGLGNIINELGN